MIIKQRYVYLAIGATVLIGVIVSVIIFIKLDDEKQNEVVTEVDDSVQIEKNISGIAEYTFSDDSLQYTAQVAFREIEGSQKECIVVDVESVSNWNQLLEERRTEIVEGLINTSRLQIDREFGCVIIEHVNTR